MCRRPQLLSEAFCCSGDQQPVCHRELLLAQPTAKMGEAQLGRKATTNTDFCPKLLFSQ